MSEDLQYRISADDAPLSNALKRVQDKFKSLGDGVNNVSSGISGSLSKITGVMAVVTAAVTGATLGIGSAISATQTFTGEANKLARVLGVGATEASTLNVALGDIYTDVDTYAGAAAKLAKEIRNNEDGLKAMGLQTRDANGQLRPLKDLMMESIQVVNGYRQGIDRNIAAQMLWGRSADEMAMLLKLNNGVLEEARKKQEALGLVVGQENVAASKAYKAAMNDVGDVMLAVKKVVGDAFIPILTKLGEWFSSIGPTAVFVFRVAINALATAIHAVLLMFELLWNTLRAIADPLFTVGSALRKLISGDIAGATADMQNIFSSWAGQLSGVWEKIKSDSARTWADIQNLWGQPTPVSPPNSTGKSAGGLVKAGPEKSLMAQWEAELAAQKEALAQQNAANGTFYEFSKQREKEFWESKRAIVAAGTQDAYGVQRKVTQATLEMQKESFEERLAQLKREGDAAEQNYTARRTLAQQELALITQAYGQQSRQAQEAQRRIEQIDRQAAEQRKQLRLVEISEIQQAADVAVELARQQKQFELDAGLVNQAEMLEAERQFELARYEIRKAALIEARNLIDPEKDPVAYAQRNAEIAALERQHQLDMDAIQKKQALERVKNYNDFFNGLQSGFQSVINKFFQGTLTIAGLFKGLFTSILDALAATLAKMAAQWIVETIKQQVMGKIVALSQVASNAAIAGSAAYAATAAIPIVGPALAPAAGAAAYVGALSFGAAIPAAEKGWDIPAGVNPITQLHQKEMVLPEGPADVLRDLAAQRAGGGGGGGQQPGTIRGMPPDEWLMVNRASLVKALQGAGRDFVFTRF